MLTVGALPSRHPAAVSYVMTRSLVLPVHVCRALPLPSDHWGQAVKGLGKGTGRGRMARAVEAPPESEIPGCFTERQWPSYPRSTPPPKGRSGAAPVIRAVGQALSSQGSPPPLPSPGIACTVSPGSHLHPSLVLSGLGLEQVETHSCQTPLDLPGIPQRPKDSIHWGKQAPHTAKTNLRVNISKPPSPTRPTWSQPPPPSPARPRIPF